MHLPAIELRSILNALFFMMRGMHRHRGSSALEILRERFARGEITQAEYEQRRELLQG